MEVIRDAQGNRIQNSANLRGIRRYVNTHAVDKVSINRQGGAGKLMILFMDRSSFESNFACWEVLQNWLRNWKGIHGADLIVNGKPAGNISSRNPGLLEGVPTAKELASELTRLKSYCEPDEEGQRNLEVRLRVHEGSWSLLFADPSYDQDHRGYWGSSYLEPRSNCRELARDLIGQCEDQYAECTSYQDYQDGYAQRCAAVGLSPETPPGILADREMDLYI